jgi:hypothetical protein
MHVFDADTPASAKVNRLSEGETMKRLYERPVVPLAFLLAALWTGRVLGADSTYRFSINGRPVTPQHYSLNADPSVLAPGDVIYVGDKQFDYGGLFMTLGEERDCRFVTASARTGAEETRGAAPRRSPRDSRVFLELPDGRRKIVGLKVSWTIIDPNEPTQGKNQDTAKRASFDRISYNPLDSLSPEEIQGLWGIQFVQWPEGIEQKLAHVNTGRVCLTVNDGAGIGGRSGSFLGGPMFPPIPVKTRYLVVENRNSPGLRDFSRLGPFRDLVFLKFGPSLSVSLDAGLICQNTSMRYLDVFGCGIPNCEKLAPLTELRFLSISHCRDFETLEFVKDMRQLRTLHMGFTRISSLSPLDNSGSIREIHAGMAQVRDLPKGDLPSLRTVNLISTKVDAQMVAQFRKEHPACRVEHGWAQSLRNALAGVTRLRIRSGGTCHRHMEQEKTLAEIAQPHEIGRFLDGIEIDEEGSNFYCGCCGNPTFEFYAEDRLVAMVGYHHGRSLRWAGGQWSTDALLTEPSQAFTISWLAQHGVEGPRREIEEAQRRRNEDARRQQRYAELIPPEILAAAMEAESKISWSNDRSGEKKRKLVADVLMMQEKDAQASIELYLRVLGVTANSHTWNTYYECQDTMAQNLLPRFKGPELAQAATHVMQDEEGILGAARWFLGENGWRNLDESDRERIVVPLAQRALQHRYRDTRMRVMNALSEIHSAWATELLRSMLSRPTDPSWPRPKTKPQYGWKIDLAGGEKVYADECSDAVWAAFCLAKMGDSASLSAIQKLAEESQEQDKELLHKALQLLREKSGQTVANQK